MIKEIMDKVSEKIIRTLTSVKFWTMIAMCAVAVAKDKGFISPAAAMEIEVALGLFLGGTAAQDWGKEKAKIANGT